MLTYTPTLDSESGVYLIRNRINGKVYAGSTVSFRHRLKEHRSRLRHGIHHCHSLQHSFNKHGEDAFEFVVFAGCARDRVKHIEQILLDVLYEEYDRSHFYNMARDVEGKDVLAGPKSMATRIALAESLRGRPLTQDELNIWAQYPTMSLARALPLHRKAMRQQARVVKVALPKVKKVPKVRPTTPKTFVHDDGRVVTVADIKAFAVEHGYNPAGFRTFFHAKCKLGASYFGWRLLGVEPKRKDGKNRVAMKHLSESHTRPTY